MTDFFTRYKLLTTIFSATDTIRKGETVGIMIIWTREHGGDAVDIETADGRRISEVSADKLEIAQ